MMATLVVGLGHPDRGDDAVGLVSAAAIRALGLTDTSVTTSVTGLLGVVDAVAACERLVVIDAIRSGAVPGTVLQYDARHLPTALRSSFSSHAVGLAEEIALLDNLGHLPTDAEIIGVELEDVTIGTDLTPAVVQSLPTVIAAVIAFRATERTGDVPG
jgi:hydrogenase maturation protease